MSGPASTTSRGKTATDAAPAVASAVAVVLSGAIVTASHPLGPHAAHMALHIVLMNVFAPLLAAWLLVRLSIFSVRMLWAAATIQLVALWAAHAPPIHDATLGSLELRVFIYGILLGSAVWFWTLVLSSPPVARWQSMFALLVTGKLTCLIAALMIFAPRPLYETLSAHGDHVRPEPLADQQLAGLLMITACPLSYLVAAIVIAAQMLTPVARDLRSPRTIPAAD